VITGLGRAWLVSKEVASGRVRLHRGGVPMRTIRFRVRTLMIAVGVLALLIWGSMMGLRSYDFYRRASFYSFEEYGWREPTISGQQESIRFDELSTQRFEGPLITKCSPTSRL
jgi:hypothetical protein